MSSIRVTNIQAKADASSPTIDEKVRVLNSQGNVVMQVDAKTSGITTVGINTTGNTFTVNANNGVTFAGVVTSTGGFSGNINSTGVSTFTTVNATSIVGVTTAGITTVYTNSINDGPLSGFRNRIINGDCRIDQRNNGTTSVTGDSTYPVDRWRIEYGGNGAISGIQTTDVPSGQGFTNALRLTSTARSTLGSGEYYQFTYTVEGYNISDFDYGSSSAKTVTLSFWVKGSRTGTYNVQLANSSGSRTYTRQYTISSANTWQKVILTYPGCPDGTWNTTNSVGFGFRFGFEYGTGFTTGASADTWISTSGFTGSFPSTTNAFMTNSNSTWFITGVQLEPGTVATPFERRSYGQELALCQRYFERRTFASDVIFCTAMANTNNTAQQAGVLGMLVEKRTSASVSGSAASTFAVNWLGNQFTCNSVSFSGSPTTVYINTGTASATGTTGVLYRVASGQTVFIDCSSEL